MKTRKEVKEELDGLKEQYSDLEELSSAEQAEQDIDVIEIQIEVLKWVLR